jgi:hypothetical protein
MDVRARGWQLLYHLKDNLLNWFLEKNNFNEQTRLTSDHASGSAVSSAGQRGESKELSRKDLSQQDQPNIKLVPIFLHIRLEEMGSDERRTSEVGDPSPWEILDPNLLEETVLILTK